MAGKPKRNAAPLGDDPGFIAAVECHTVTGHLVLIDLKKTALEIDLEGSDQWLIIHVPSYQAATWKTRRAARTDLNVLAIKGGPWIDGIKETRSEWDDSPSAAPAKRKAPRKASAKKKTPAKKKQAAKKKKAPASPKKKKSASRVRVRETKKKSATKTKTPKQADKETTAQAQEVEALVDGQFAIQETIDPTHLNNDLIVGLDAQFSNRRINDLIEEMWTSQRPIVIKGKKSKSWDPEAGEKDDKGKPKGAWIEVVTPDRIEWVANWSAREKALELVVKYKIGNPLQRLEVKAQSDLTMEELEKFAEESPAFAQALEQLVTRVKTKKP